MKSKHNTPCEKLTLDCSCWEEKLFLWLDKFLCENKISELYIKNSVTITFIQKDKNICMSDELDVSMWRSRSDTGVEFLVIFTFFIKFFMRTLIKSIIYRQTVPLDVMFIVKILFQSSLPSFLTWVSLAIFCFTSMPNANCQFSSASFSLVGNNSLVHEVRVMGSCWTTCKCNILCPASCIEISLVMEKTNR